jgi:hypothetical protein
MSCDDKVYRRGRERRAWLTGEKERESMGVERDAVVVAAPACLAIAPRHPRTALCVWV